MGGKTGMAAGLALLLAAGMAWAGGVSGGEGGRGPSSVLHLQADTQTVQKNRALGICMPWDYLAPGNQPAEGQGAIGPNYEARSYFSLYEKREAALPPISAVQLNKKPQHGTVTPYKHPGSGIDGWRYLPEGGYTGNDRVEFLVDVQGMPVRVVYYFKVTKLDIDRGEAEGLCKQFQWKISASPMLQIPLD